MEELDNNTLAIHGLKRKENGAVVDKTGRIVSLTLPAFKVGPEAISIADVPMINTQSDAYQFVFSHFKKTHPKLSVYQINCDKAFRETYKKYANISRLREMIVRPI